MKKDYTDVTIILDRSGSMMSIQHDTVGGLKSFIDDQKKLPGECKLTLIEFDLPDRGAGIAYDKLYDAKPVAEVGAIPFEPRGWTPLRDAIGRAINETGARFAAMKEEDRPEIVIFAIITDGEENSSKEFSQAQIKAMVERQTKEFNWHFTYLGANVDAFSEAEALGVSKAAAIAYGANAKGVFVNYCNLSANTTRVRSHQTRTMSYTAEERKSAEDNITKHD